MCSMVRDIVQYWSVGRDEKEDPQSITEWGLETTFVLFASMVSYTQTHTGGHVETPTERKMNQ